MLYNYDAFQLGVGNEHWLCSNRDTTDEGTLAPKAWTLKNKSEKSYQYDF